MTGFYFYTITIDGTKYRAVCNYSSLRWAARHFGVNKEQIERGADG